MRNQKLLTALAIGLNLALIWGNSLLPGDDSGAMSDWVMKLLSFLPQTELAHTILRKAAHFSEFALLGLLVGRMGGLCAGNPRWSLAGFGLAAGCIDETIQLFTPGRASSLVDVWIDTAGFAAGLSLVIFVYHYKKRKELQR